MVPIMIAVVGGVLINNSRLSDLRAHIDRRMNEMSADLKQTWRSELLRVEGVIDARLKHLEER